MSRKAKTPTNITISYHSFILFLLISVEAEQRLCRCDLFQPTSGNLACAAEEFAEPGVLSFQLGRERDCAHVSVESNEILSNGGGEPCHSLTLRNRSALPTTDSELRLIATLAQTGEISTPKTG